MDRRSRILTLIAVTALTTTCLAQPAFAADDEPHGGVEPGTHPSGEVYDGFGGAGSGPIARDPGTLVIDEPAPPGDERLGVYPDTEDRTPGVFHTRLGGMTTREVDSYKHAAGKGGGDGSGGGDKKTPDTTSVRNSRAGKKDPGKPVMLDVFRPGADVDSFDVVTLNNPRDLESLARVEPLTSTGSDGKANVFAYIITFTQTLTSSPTDVSKAIFRLTGGLFDSCVINGNAYVCSFATPKTIRTSRSPLTTPAVDLSARQIPLCSGVVEDGGAGLQTVITVADVDCEAAPGKQPVRLEVSRIYSDLALGIPTAREGDGSIIYSATPEAAGMYVSAEVWAVAADGTYSLPFPIAVRNRYAPAGTPAAALPLEAVRGVDTVIPSARLFSDEDVDRHLAESADQLTPTVTDQGALGGAWFDAAGDLHYQSIDVIHGEYTDHVTVKATDAFGLHSPEVRLNIHVADIVPGCATGGATTDALTPVRVQLTCSITPLAGWRQLGGLEYAVTELPEFGTLSEFDPVAGTATYTPDPGHPGPVSIGFSADNNGAVRSTSFAVNVLPAP